MTADDSAKTGTPLPDSKGRSIPSCQFGISPNIDLERDGALLGSGPFKPLREKRWVFVGIVNKDLIAGAAVVHLGYLSNAFAYVWIREKKELIESSVILPPGPWVHFERRPISGTVEFSCPLSKFKYEMAADGKLLLSFRDGFRNRLAIHANLDLPTISDGILQAINPVNENHWAYTCKIAGIPVAGSVRANGRQIVLDSLSTTGFIDWTLGYHNRTTVWKWATSSGVTERQVQIAFNFSSEVYDRGLGENTIWLNNQPELFSSVVIEHNPSSTDSSWLVSDKAGRIRLRFVPEGKRQENINLGFLASKFTQFFGEFSGTIISSDNTEHSLSGCPGFLEDHHSIW